MVGVTNPRESTKSADHDSEECDDAHDHDGFVSCGKCKEVQDYSIK